MAMENPFEGKEIWFGVGSQDLYGEEALRQVGCASFDRAVVAIGSDIEASVLTVLALSEAGIDYPLRALEKPSDHAPIWASFR